MSNPIMINKDDYNKNIKSLYTSEEWDLISGMLDHKNLFFIPVGIEKRPNYCYVDIFKGEKKVSPEGRVDLMLARQQVGLALCCGLASGGAEAIDFDQRGILFEAWKKEIPSSLFEKLYIERSSGGGYHVIYTSEVIEKSQKLAYVDPEGKKIGIETRGNGSLIVVYPSKFPEVDSEGKIIKLVNKSYTLIQGDVLNLPRLTAGQRNLLLNEARRLNSHKIEVKLSPTHFEFKPKNFTEDDFWLINPWEDFNSKNSAEEILESHGWVKKSENENNIFFTRPDSKSGGIHASLSKETGSFHIFTTNEDLKVIRKNGDVKENNFTPAEIYSFYNFGGSMEKMYEYLMESGYGKRK